MAGTGTKPEFLLTVRQAAEAWPAFSEPSLRSLIFDAPRNGLDAAGAIVRLGRRVYIDGERWAAWIASRQESKA